jgi:hypothetical protein
LTRERANKPNLAVRIGRDVPIRGFFARDSSGWIGLAIDEDEHAQHVIELVDHRDHQHRAPSITVALIELHALLEVRVALQVVDVGDDDRFLGECGMTNQTRLVHRMDRHRRVGYVMNGIELVQNGMQPPTAVFIGLNQHQPSAVAVGEPLPLHDDHPEQGLAVTLAHECDGDPAQLLEFRLGALVRVDHGRTGRIERASVSTAAVTDVPSSPLVVACDHGPLGRACRHQPSSFNASVG